MYKNLLRGKTGQTTVEFALIFLLLMFFIFSFYQFTIIFTTHAVTTYAANTAGRAWSVDGNWEYAAFNIVGPCRAYPAMKVEKDIDIFFPLNKFLSDPYTVIGKYKIDHEPGEGGDNL